MADRAVGFHCPLNTDVLACKPYAHALIAPHAMEKVTSESFPSAANIATVTVVNVFAWIIVEEFTNRTEINGHLVPTILRLAHI
jgi:hypothetical protein